MQKTREVKIGNIAIGANHPIAIQSMLNVRAEDIAGNVIQAQKLVDAGCEIIRVAITDKNSIRLIDAIKSKVSLPLVADIQFDYKMAIEAVYAGVDKIRINPGNIGSNEKVKQVVDACKQKNIPIRVGINAGSLEKDLLAKYGAPTAEALSESAVLNVRLLEQFDFEDIVISIKSSNVDTCVNAYRRISQIFDYPLHIGITEAGTNRMGLIKSAAGLGALLIDGIGDTIRVSLTADPVEEVRAAQDILMAVDKRSFRPQIISCPTCGRTKIDLINLAKQVEQATSGIKKDIKIAVMGCAVNGPGEAREADIGIAGGDGCGLLFKKGEIIKKVPENEMIQTLLSYIKEL